MMWLTETDRRALALIGAGAGRVLLADGTVDDETETRLWALGLTEITNGAGIGGLVLTAAGVRALGEEG